MAKRRRPLRDLLISAIGATDLASGLIRELFEHGVKVSLEVDGKVLPVKVKLEVDDE